MITYCPGGCQHRHALLTQIADAHYFSHNYGLISAADAPALISVQQTGGDDMPTPSSQLNKCGRLFERCFRPVVGELLAVTFDVFIVCLVEQHMRDRLQVPVRGNVDTYLCRYTTSR
jgi:hypothetical protein